METLEINKVEIRNLQKEDYDQLASSFTRVYADGSDVFWTPKQIDKLIRIFPEGQIVVVVDGKIVAGAHGAGGEVGHACVEPEEEAVCICGNHGCLEQMTSATGIVRLAKKYLASHDTPSSLRERGESISAKAVLDAQKEGDEAAEAIVQEFSEYLGRALAVFACVVDPEVIVVGGGVSKAGQILIDGVAKYYREAAFIACKDTPIVLASLGNDAGIYGAAKMLID